MPKRTLIATSDPAFGDWLRASLLESGRFDVRVAANAAEALRIARELPAALAVLDDGLPGQPLAALKAALQAEGVRVLTLSADAGPGQPDALARPFTLVDLFARLDALAGQNRSAPLWLDDPARVREDLSALLPETSARAALILYEGHLWAWAGTLENGTAQEAAAALPADALTGLVRFVRLSMQPSDYLLYAVGIQDGLALALLFPLATALAQAGRQTRALAQALPQRTTPINSPLPVAEFPPEDDLDEPTAGEDEALIEAMQKELAALLAGMPSPDPLERTEPEESAQPAVFTEPVEANTAAEPAADSSPPIPAWLVDAPPAKPAPAPRPVSDTAPRRVQPPAEPARPKGEGIGMVSSAADGAKVNISSVVAEISYTYLLVSAAPAAILTGELSASLRLWLPQICLAFGWRLENFKVSPESLEWSLRLTPGMPLGQVARVVRQRTSQKIYHQFPHLGSGQPGQDFWAPRYLVQRGTQPFSAAATRKFIVETRRAQGYIVSE